MADANRDQNYVPVALGQSNTDASVTLPFKISSSTGRLLTDSASGSGDVVGPASATDNAVVLFDGTTGKLIKDSTIQQVTTVFSPTVSDGVALGSGSLMWSDLFLASGAVVNFNNGNVVLTHSAGILTMGTGEMRITTVGTNTASVVTVGGTQTLTGKTYDTAGAGNSFSINGTAITAVTGTGAVVLANSPTFVDDITVGVAASATGSILFKGLTSGTVTLKVADAAGTYTLTLPTDDGDSGQVLSTDGNGVLSWVSAGGVPTTITVANEATDTSCFIAFFTAASGDLGPKTNVNMTFDSSTGIVTLASSVLTTTDINGGTIDGVTIGGASPGNITGLVITANTGFMPDANDGAYLGQAGTAFSDLFLAEGGVINWDSGDATITQTGNVLAVAGADFRIATADVGTNADSVPTLSSTNTLTNKTLTSPTINTANIGGITQLAEGASVALDAAGSADGAYSGITIAGTAGATLAFGDLIYLAAADSRWELTDADAASTSGDVIIGMCVLAAAADGDPTRILLYGNIRADAAFPALTVGAPAYVSTTTGDIQTAQPSGTDDVIRRVGFALTADELLFNPSNDYVTHT